MNTRTLVAILEKCPATKRVALMSEQPCVILLEVETIQGTTLPLPGLDLNPRVEEIDRFTPWLDRKIRRLEDDFSGTIPKSYRLKRQFRYCDDSVTLHLCIPPRQWGIMSTVLTSPERFAKRLLTSRTSGGFLPVGWQVEDEGVIRRLDGSYVFAPDEEDVFAALTLPFVPRPLRK